MTESGVWRVRPAGATHQGRPVPFPRLATAIADEAVGDLDEVQAPRQRNWTTVAENPLTANHLPSPRRVIPREPEEAESDMTPMIDVTFQLVIFFMIAATYSIQKTLDLPGNDAPEERSSMMTMEELERNNIMVAIGADGSVQVNEQAIPLNELATHLKQAIRRSTTAELVLDVDDQAVHDVVVKVLDAAGAAQIEKVLFVSRVAAREPAAVP